jgi:aminopeptidase N
MGQMLIKLMRFSALPAILFISLSSFSQAVKVSYLDDPSWQVADKAVDLLHLTARLSINPFDTIVEGKVTFLFKPVMEEVDSFQFSTPDMTFTKVEIEGMKVTYREAGNALVIFPGSKLEKENEYTLNLDYTARPVYDLFHIGWSEPALRDNKQIWAHRPSHWLPYSDDRLTVDMYITFDGKYKVFSNGVRESVTDNNDGTRTWHYKMYREHPFFSTALVIGQYEYLEDTTGSGVPLELWYYPWNRDHAEPTYRYTAEMFTFLEDELGFPYPYELYREAPVEDYLYGAMETTTSTVFGDYLAVDERAWDGRNYVNVNIHELTHQWFGNCLSHLRGRDVWLTESFATYYAKMFEKHVFGDDYYDWVRDQELIEAMEASKKDGYAVGHSRGGRARWYPKGSLVLDMLRDVMGDADFKAAIKKYLEDNAFSEVETSEFLAAVREATGKSMEWFFDEWIYRGGEPKYQVSWREAKTINGLRQTIIAVKQVQARDELVGLFKMPIPIDVYYEDGTVASAIPMISEEFQEVAIDNPENKEVSFVLFDPGRRIMKNVDFIKGFEEWSAQLLHAKLMIDRYDALHALKEFPVNDKMDVLKKAYKHETFHLIKGEIIRQLGAENIDGWQNDPDPYVRRAAILSEPSAPAKLQKDFEAFLEDQSYINVELSLDLLCRSFPDKVPQYLEATKNESGWRGLNIRMKWLEIAIGSGKSEYLGELVDYAGPHYEFETRMNAFQLLKRLNYLDSDAAVNLVDGYLYWNYKVSNAAKEVLQYFYQQNEYKVMIDLAALSGRFSALQQTNTQLMLHK